MELRYFLPRADLRPFVRVYYYFASEAPSVQPMCAELGNIRVLLDGEGFMTMPGGHQAVVSSAFLVGPTNGAYVMSSKSPTRAFGVGIRPRGWNSLLGIDAAEAADQVIDLSDFAGSIAGTAIEQIRNAESDQEMIDAADQFFSNLIDRRIRQACAYPQALEHWLLNPDDLDLDRLLDLMDVSRRQTDRIAKKFFGASPKLLQRKHRALRAADRIRAGDMTWNSAASASFYDQSHFIKEFKTFVGVTPNQFMTNQAELIAQVQASRQTAQSRLPLASL